MSCFFFSCIMFSTIFLTFIVKSRLRLSRPGKTYGVGLICEWTWMGTSGQWSFTTPGRDCIAVWTPDLPCETTCSPLHKHTNKHLLSTWVVESWSVHLHKPTLVSSKERAGPIAKVSPNFALLDIYLGIPSPTSHKSVTSQFSLLVVARTFARCRDSRIQISCYVKTLAKTHKIYKKRAYNEVSSTCYAICT